jgi:DNA-binding CsgD family transcriptional regulator
MDKGLQALVTELSQLNSFAAVWSCMSNHAQELGLPVCNFTLAQRNGGLQSLRFGTNLPEEFRDNYCSGGLIEVDPFLTIICKTMLVSGIVTDPKRFPGANEPQRKFLELTRSLGVKSALCVPVRTNMQSEFGGWIIGGSEDGVEFQKVYANLATNLQLAGLLAFERMAALGLLKKQVPNSLSPRERECLLWLSAGLRVATIADRLGISESAVALYIGNARRKLGAKTREQALARAIMNGEIQP